MILEFSEEPKAIKEASGTLLTVVERRITEQTSAQAPTQQKPYLNADPVVKTILTCARALKNSQTTRQLQGVQVNRSPPSRLLIGDFSRRVILKS
jgi:hypothetical protein